MNGLIETLFPHDNLGQSIEYGYDAHDNLVRSDTGNADGSVALTVGRAFDTRNRLAEIRAPHEDGRDSVIERVLDANGNVTTRVDPRGNDLHNTFDGADRLVSNRHRLDGVTGYAYDSNDRVTRVTAPNGATTTFRHDPLGRRLTEDSPDRGELTFSYDLANNVKSITDARGITTRLEYDALERVTARRYPNSIPGRIEDVAYEYDTCPFGTGRLCRRTDESGTWAFAYDAFGNVVRVTRTVLGVAYTTEYTYDGDDNLTGITYPSGRVVTIDRDGVRRPLSISAEVNGTRQTLVSDIAYRGDDRMVARTFGNGLVDTRSYDHQGRLTEQRLGAVDNRNYAYDANGNVLERTATPQVSAYGYDALDRLTVDASALFEYDYDPNHNRQAKTRNATGQTLNEHYAYRNGSNRLDRVSTRTSGTLDPRVGERELRYNDAGRLFRVIDDGELTAEYVYNADGQRTRKVVHEAGGSTTTTLYHYDLRGQLIAETDATGAPIRDYVWSGPLRPVAQIDRTSGNDSVVYLHTDHLMTPRLATNEAGQVVWRWEGEAFGSTKVSGGFSTTINLRFPGQYFDAETDLHQNWWRIYDPGTGRYVRVDPIGLGGGSNAFAYAYAAPIRFYDPFGLDATVILYPGPGGYGHLGIGVNTDKTSGFYPTEGASELSIVIGEEVPGVMKLDTKEPIATIVIPLTEEQDHAIQQYLDERSRNPGPYDLYDRNCATTVGNALKSGGIDTPDTVLPQKLFDYLDQKYNSDLTDPEMGYGPGG